MGLFDFVGDLLGFGSGEAQGAAGQASAFASQALFQPFSIQSSTGSVSPTAGGLAVSLSPALQRLQGQILGGVEHLDFSGEETLGLLNRLAAPSEEQARLDLESRLFSQGLLGTTTGALQQGALSEAQGQAGLERQVQALTLGPQLASILTASALGISGLESELLKGSLQGSEIKSASAARAAGGSAQAGEVFTGSDPGDSLFGFVGDLFSFGGKLF